MSNRTNTKPAAIDTLSPLRRIERRLIGNVVGAQNSVKYWQDDIVRLEALPTRGPSTDERIALVWRKVNKLETELALATEELDAFRNLAGL